MATFSESKPMTAVCQKRLQKELVAIRKTPVEHISAAPNENNLLEWHYVIEGPPGSVYEGGFYHGVLRFPKDYPYKPPSIIMFTRNGRFKQNVRLCLSMSDYHPESWNPMWSVSSILSGLMSFMLDSQTTLGSMEASDEVRRQYAKQSLKENLRNPVFRTLFPHYVTLAQERSIRQRDESIEAPPASGVLSPLENEQMDPNFAEEDQQAYFHVDEPPVQRRDNKIKMAVAILVAALAIVCGITLYNGE